MEFDWSVTAVQLEFKRSDWSLTGVRVGGGGMKFGCASCETHENR